MVITNSFEIFANKYHNNQHLPNDIINIIMNINTKEIKEEKENKKRKGLQKALILELKEWKNWYNQLAEDDEDFEADNGPFFDFTLTTISDGDDCSHLPGWAGRFKIYDDEVIQNILNEWY
tara:strand:- start:311 stop:673 length:363 start_codon:yes stop_codon:yes gene_type:complete